MKIVGQRLRTLRAERGISQASLAEQLRISKSSVNMYERGEREPGFETVNALADHFGVDTDYLLGKSYHRTKEEWLKNADRPSYTLPILGEIACGQPIFANEEAGEYIEADARLEADFCLRAKGDSMVGARILDGDLVFIRKQDTVANGEIAAVLIEDTATLKRVYYYPNEGTLSLHAENPLYPPLVYNKEELNRIRILGKAVSFQSTVK